MGALGKLSSASKDWSELGGLDAGAISRMARVEGGRKTLNLSQFLKHSNPCTRVWEALQTKIGLLK